MESAIEVAEAGHLVIGTLNTNSCASTIGKIISFYEKSDEQNIKFLLSSVLKLVISQKIIKSKEDKLVLIPEVMVIDDTVSGEIRKEKITEDELEEVIQNSLGNGSISFIDSIAQLFIEDIITLEQAKAQIKDKDIEILNRKIMQLKIKKKQVSIKYMIEEVKMPEYVYRAITKRRSSVKNRVESSNKQNLIKKIKKWRLATNRYNSSWKCKKEIKYC